MAGAMPTDNTKTPNAECRNCTCSEWIFIIQALLELHMVDESGEGQKEILTLYNFDATSWRISYLR